MANFVNLVFYQVGWFACVLGIAWGFQGLGVSVALALVGLHVYLATERIIQIKLCLTAAAVGLIADSGQLWGGVFEFPSGKMIVWLPPPAMTVLWLQFGTTLQYCMSWLSKRYVLCALFGLIGAPVAFYAGERLGAVVFLPPRLLHFGTLGLVWCCVVPLLVYISDRWSSGKGSAAYRWSVSET